MVKTASFGQPCAAPEPGRCRICGCHSRPTVGLPAFQKVVPVDAFVCVITDGHLRRHCNWADETQTLCDNPKCVAAARAEIGR